METKATTNTTTNAVYVEKTFFIDRLGKEVTIPCHTYIRENTDGREASEVTLADAKTLQKIFEENKAITGAKLIVMDQDAPEAYKLVHDPDAHHWCKWVRLVDNQGYDEWSLGEGTMETLRDFADKTNPGKKVTYRASRLAILKYYGLDIQLESDDIVQTPEAQRDLFKEALLKAGMAAAEKAEETKEEVEAPVVEEASPEEKKTTKKRATRKKKSEEPVEEAKTVEETKAEEAAESVEVAEVSQEKAPAAEVTESVKETAKSSKTSTKATSKAPAKAQTEEIPEVLDLDEVIEAEAKEEAEEVAEAVEETKAVEETETAEETTAAEETVPVVDATEVEETEIVEESNTAEATPEVEEPSSESVEEPAEQAETADDLSALEQMVTNVGPMTGSTVIEVVMAAKEGDSGFVQNIVNGVLKAPEAHPEFEPVLEAIKTVALANGFVAA